MQEKDKKLRNRIGPFERLAELEAVEMLIDLFR